VSSNRIRALVLLLRYSGMRIGDTATCPTGRLTGDRLFLYTQKTGIPVNVKLPPFVVEALNTMSPISREYFFWTGEGKKETVARKLAPQSPTTIHARRSQGRPSAPISRHLRCRTFVVRRPARAGFSFVGSQQYSDHREALFPLDTRSPGAARGGSRTELGERSCDSRRDDGYTTGTRERGGC